MQPFFLLTVAVAVSMLVILAAWRLAPHIGMVDMPDPRKVHVVPVPRVGGWGIVAGSLLPPLLLLELDPLLRSYAMGSVVLFLFGAWDDARQISHWPKFVGQFIAVALVVFHGGLYVTRLPFLDGEVLAGLPGQLFTLVAMAGVINALNHSDGLDGLAGGEAVLSLIGIAFLGYLVDSGFAVGLALATIGGIVGFLRYNTHPAKVFMGDSGSQFLGFTLAVLVVYVIQIANTAASPAMPALLLGLPVADILMVVYLRASNGQHLLKASRNHVHHRLLDLGFTHFESVTCIYLVQSLLVVLAVALRYEADAIVLTSYFAVIVAVFAALRLAERQGWRRRPLSGVGYSSPASQSPQMPRLRNVLRHVALAIAALLVPTFMLVGPLSVQSIPRDFGLVAIWLAVLLVVSLIGTRRQATGGALVRLIAFVAAACGIYFLTLGAPTASGEVLEQAGIAMGVLAVALGAYMVFLSAQKFALTPTDYLVMLGVVSLTFFDRLDFALGSAVHFATYLIVMFYGCEVILGQMRLWRLVLALPVLATLSVVAFRGLVAS